MINSVIHETILRDIVDVITDVKDEYNDAKSAVTGSKGGTNFTSIARASSNLVLVFPFMCDSTVSMETASMTAKAIERQCVSMLRLLFSAVDSRLSPPSRRPGLSDSCYRGRADRFFAPLPPFRCPRVGGQW